MFGITAGVIRLLFSFNEWDMTQYLLLMDQSERFVWRSGLIGSTSKFN